jgi:prepilin-type N-terminal cleavage/methylation domain-containing protein
MRRDQGFSLAELLIALAVTAILIVLLGNIVSATLTAWQQGRNRLDTFSNARQIIGRIADELSAAIALRDRIEFVENSGSLGGAPPTPKTSETVFFVAPYPNSGSGDLCVVAYRHNAAERRLERAFKNSTEAWAPGAATRYRAGGYSSGSNALVWRPVAMA